MFEARAQPYGAATPLGPVLELLRSAYFGVTPNDTPMSAAVVVADRLAAIGATEAADLALVCDFLGIPFSESPPPWLSANARNARLLEIVSRLVRQRGTAISVVIIEDLHWLDEASEAFVAALAHAVVATRTMLIVNYRPGYSKPWMDTSKYRQIALTEFNPSDTDRLVDELIGPDAELAEIRQRIATRSGGNPFFAEELVRSLVDHNLVTGQPGAYRRGPTVGMAALPATVQAVIGARIDRLPQSERDLLHIGAIIGKEFPLSVLQSVSGQEPGEVDATLEHLCAAGLLHRSESSDGRGCGFRHPLIQEVAYATQLKTRRGSLHAAVARAIEHFHPDRREEFAALIAYHLEEAGELERAASYAARAARWIGLTSSAQAMKHWHKVRVLLAGTPRSRTNDRLRIEASAKIAWLGWREGLTTAQAQPFVQEALEWAREIDDSMVPLLLLVDGRIAQVSGGKSDAFVQQIRRAITLAENRGDIGRIATLHASLSHAYGWAGLLREALEASDAALAGVADVTDFDHQFLGYSVEHWTWSLRGRILLRLGRFDAARACFDRIIGIKGLIDPTVLFVAHFGYVDMAWCLDDAAMGAEHAARIAAIAARFGSAYLRLYQLASGAMADGVTGDYDRAIQGMTNSLEFLRQTRAAIEFEPELLASLADYLARKGDHLEAVRVAGDAIALARLRDARLPLCRATITLASLSVLAKGARACDEAAVLLAEAERLIAELGACIYQPRLDEARRLLDDCISGAGGGPAG